jgi:hypothetical protein
MADAEASDEEILIFYPIWWSLGLNLSYNAAYIFFTSLSIQVVDAYLSEEMIKRVDWTSIGCLF